MIEEILQWKALSRKIPIPLHIPGLIPEEFVYLFRFCQTAEFFSKNKRYISERYVATPELLKKDLHDGQEFEKRLEFFIQKGDDSPKTKEFAEEYLPYIKKFNKIVKEYAPSLSTKT